MSQALEVCQRLPSGSLDDEIDQRLDFALAIIVADDGERLSLFEWESADALHAWATHPEYIPVPQLGRQKFYTEYHLQVCELVRASKSKRDAEQDQGPG